MNALLSDYTELSRLSLMKLIIFNFKVIEKIGTCQYHYTEIHTKMVDLANLPLKRRKKKKGRQNHARSSKSSGTKGLKKQKMRCAKSIRQDEHQTPLFPMSFKYSGGDNVARAMQYQETMTPYSSFYSTSNEQNKVGIAYKMTRQNLCAHEHSKQVKR